MTANALTLMLFHLTHVPKGSWQAEFQVIDSHANPANLTGRPSMTNINTASSTSDQLGHRSGRTWTVTPRMMTVNPNSIVTGSNPMAYPDDDRFRSAPLNIRDPTYSVGWQEGNQFVFGAGLELVPSQSARLPIQNPLPDVNPRVRARTSSRLWIGP